MDYVALAMIFLFLLVLAALVLYARQRNFYTKESAPSPSHNSRRNAISKKDAEYSRSMYRLEDEQDAMDSVDYGEAYNFHMDCGDR